MFDSESVTLGQIRHFLLAASIVFESDDFTDEDKIIRWNVLQKQWQDVMVKMVKGFVSVP